MRPRLQQEVTWTRQGQADDLCFCVPAACSHLTGVGRGVVMCGGPGW
jgi:hypothetical protein